MKKLAIVLSHPIQYYSPLFKLLADRRKIQIKVYYTWGIKSIKKKYDQGFRREIEWDIPLLEGYDYEFLNNISPLPGTHHFLGIVNYGAITTINRWQPDAILVFGWNFFSHLNILNYYKGKIPVFFRGDSTILGIRRNSLKAYVKKSLLKGIYHRVYKAFYVGTNNKEYFLEYGLSEEQLVFAPHAVDNMRFASGVCDENDIFKLGFNNSERVILFVGKLEKKKNPEILIRAFKQLKLDNISLVIAGNGLLKEYIKSITYSQFNIKVIDFQNQTMMPNLYALADVFVLPSRGPNETWGLAVNEAMAAGCAVVVSNMCGCAIDLVHNGVNGFIFDWDNPLSLSNALNEALTHTVEMGANSKKIIHEWSLLNCAIAIEQEIIKLDLAC